MRKVWIVVANSTHAHIYNAKNVNHFENIRTFEHADGRKRAADLVSDRQGRETNRHGFGVNTIEEKTSLKEKEMEHFASEIAQFLLAGHNDKAYERLYLIVKPPFLNILKKTCKPPVAKSIYQEIQKDLTHEKPEQMREYLPPVL